MVTITDVIQCQVAMQSQEIHRIKADALEIRSVEQYYYLSPDGKTRYLILWSQGTQSPNAEGMGAGWKVEKVVRQEVVRHISPKHPQWGRYRAAQRRASLLLTARLLLKCGGEAVPEMAVIRHQLAKQALHNHARRGQARSVCFAAYRYLRKLNNRLQRAPEKFADVAIHMENLAAAGSGHAAGERQ
jgi:hypothetical protein